MKNRSAAWLLLMVWSVLGAAGALAQDHVTWHAPGWKYRVMVQVPPSTGKDAADVAQVRIIHAGTAAKDANDYRIFDLAGKPVAYQVVFHDPARDTLISFQCESAGGYRVIYYGNAEAPADPMRAVDSPAPGQGPPVPGAAAQGWIPRAGLVLATYDRPIAAASPENMREMASLVTIARSNPQGGGYRDHISDGMNPFGDSDDYVSVYRGWITLPVEGLWGFCTDSSNASFSFMDGKPLVQWPGRHNENPGRRGEINAQQNLTAGLHYLEYYHEHQRQRPMAFLGIKPPGAHAYTGIDPSWFVQPRVAKIIRHQTADLRPFVVPRVELVDAALLDSSPWRQLTRWRFTADLPPQQGEDWQVTWQFGDGQLAVGALAEHVFLHTGPYKVTMNATGDQGQHVTMVWPLVVFPMLYQSDELKTAKAADYASLLMATPPENYQGDDAALLAMALDEIHRDASADKAARFALFHEDTQAHFLQPMMAILWNQEPPPADEAPALLARLEKAVAATQDATAKVSLLAKLMELVGVQQKNLSGALKYDQQARTLASEKAADPAMKEAQRLATMAMGDAYLHAGKTSQALERYHQAESLATKVLSGPAMAARSGLYPQHVDQQLAAGKIDDARTLIQRWQDEIPSDKVQGVPLFYEGKVFIVRKNFNAAISPLQLASQLLRGSEYEAQNNWLLAEAYRQDGQPKAARDTLRRLIQSGLTGPWVDQARSALEKQP